MNSPVRPVYKSDARGRVALTERLADWSSMAHGAFAANTVRAWKADWEIFGEYCQGIGAHSMPAMAETVRGFVFECLARHRRIATQDLLALNIYLASVMQAGRWKDTRMPMRYGEKVVAHRGGMARAAKEQGRG